MFPALIMGHQVWDFGDIADYWRGELTVSHLSNSVCAIGASCKRDFYGGLLPVKLLERFPSASSFQMSLLGTSDPGNLQDISICRSCFGTDASNINAYDSTTCNF